MTKTEQNRLLGWRLKLLREAHVARRSVARTCRHFGISRKTFYKWKSRHRAYGEAGLCDRPRVPLRSPRETPREVISKILYLRQRYHFGPRRIAAYLKRFHQLSVACSTGRARLERYVKPQPGHRLQLDVKFLDRIAGTGRRLYQFTAIDDCTRIQVLKIFDSCNQTSAIRFVDESGASTVSRPRSAVSHRMNGAKYAKHVRDQSSRPCTPAYIRRSRRYRKRASSPWQSATHSRAGPLSRATAMTAGSRSTITPPNERSAPLPWAARPGPLLDPMMAASVPRQSTVSSAPRNSTIWTPKATCVTCLSGSRTIRSIASRSYCLGTSSSSYRRYDWQPDQAVNAAVTGRLPFMV